MKTTTINCDTCGNDLLTSGNSIDYRIHVHSERIPSAGGTVTDMMMYPDFKDDLYFCNRVCFNKHFIGGLHN